MDLTFHPWECSKDQLRTKEEKKQCSSKTNLAKYYHILDFIRGKSISDLIKNSHLLFVLFERKWFFLNMEALIHSALTKDILFNRSIDHKTIKSSLIRRGCSLPFGWWYNLNNLKNEENETGLSLSVKSLPWPSHSFFYKVYPTFRRIRKSS